MTNMSKSKSRLRALRITAPAALLLALSGCGGDDGGNGPIGGGPTPTPAPTTAGLDVVRCLEQTIPGGGGFNVLGAAIPDVLNINTAEPAGFPNGRTTADPVADIILAMVLLDLNASGQALNTFANLPLNPDFNDVPLPTTFPFVADPQGNPPIPAGVAGSSFNFRSDAPSSYARVDRFAVPALGTVLIPAGQENLAYNDGTPAIDASGRFANDIVGELTQVTEAIGDDLVAAGFNICAD